MYGKSLIAIGTLSVREQQISSGSRWLTKGALDLTLPGQCMDQLMEMDRDLGLTHDFAAGIDQPQVGDHAERVAVARIHEDAWLRQNPTKKDIILR